MSLLKMLIIGTGMFMGMLAVGAFFGIADEYNPLLKETTFCLSQSDGWIRCDNN